MTAFNLTCEAVEATLPDYLDGVLEGWLRNAIEEHLGECGHCSALLRDLRNNAREAAALPALVPQGDIWPRIASRIGAPLSDSAQTPERAPSLEIARPIPFTAESPPLTTESVPLTTESLPPSEPPELPSNAAALTSEAPSVELTSEPASEVAFEPPSEVFASEPFLGLLTSEARSGLLEFEPHSVNDDLPLETNKPLTVVSEPPVPTVTKPLPTAEPVVPLRRRREKRFGPALTGLAAAALVLVTAGTTFLLTVHWLGPAQTTKVARGTDSRKPSSSDKPAGARRTGGHSVERGQVALDSPTQLPPSGEPHSLLTASAIAPPPVQRSAEEMVYDKEIHTLSRIMKRQKSELEPSTVTVIEKNLGTLDSAITQIRAALQQDPNSDLLSGQASRALEMKVELLRRAAMLRSST
ncbi:MAG: zf-HC2 domain-containing protein [Actinobacteria bacterium]|nr:zf-HC2 domain-containing protein [Actinomycetota bacterium]